MRSQALHHAAHHNKNNDSGPGQTIIVPAPNMFVFNGNLTRELCFWTVIHPALKSVAFDSNSCRNVLNVDVQTPGSECVVSMFVLMKIYCLWTNTSGKHIPNWAPTFSSLQGDVALPSSMCSLPLEGRQSAQPTTDPKHQACFGQGINYPFGTDET